jgi:SAM-dependent methyltransferase
MRLAGQAKGGFFPTPPVVVERVARMIGVPRNGRPGVIRLLDPCCGEGVALAQLAKTLDAEASVVRLETFGVELHRGRYEKARVVLDRTLCSDVFQIMASHAVFHLLLLNPPYDYDDEKLRLEHKFLINCTRYLAPGGLLVFLVPQPRLRVSARYLASHFGQMACYRFPDPEFEAYRQVVLTAIKRSAPVTDPQTEATIARWSEDDLPPLTDSPEPSYLLTTGQTGPVLFGARSLDVEAAITEARQNGHWASHEVRGGLWPVETPIARPLMPLRRGHIAMLIAAGFLNNLTLESGGKRVLVKGRTRKEFVLAESTDETETHREVLRTSVVALDLRTGEFEEIQA